MATLTSTTVIGPADQGRAMSLRAFATSQFEEGWLYELARGVIDVTEVPGFSHAVVVDRLSTLFVHYRDKYPGIIVLRGGGAESRIRSPGLQSDRHPDQAVYLKPPPKGKRIWTKWVPEIAVEVVSHGGEHRDYIEKREEYLRIGVLEYWIIDLAEKTILILVREADVWRARRVKPGRPFHSEVLPGLTVRYEEILQDSD